MYQRNQMEAKWFEYMMLTIWHFKAIGLLSNNLDQTFLNIVSEQCTINNIGIKYELITIVNLIV